MKKMGIFIAAASMLLLAACGKNQNSNFVSGKYYSPANQTVEGETGTETGTPEVETAAIGGDLFLITSNDMQSQCLILEQLASGKQYMYNYSLTTRFLDKYGNRTTVSCFEPGRVICVGKKDNKGRLLEAQISNQVWEYPDVTRFSVDEGRGVFKIADTNYSYREGVFIASDGGVQKMSDLTSLDTIRVVGMNKEILSVSVTTGHGELALENTKVFEGSYIQVGSKVFSEITGQMSMELPEGVYTVAVANNGYGGNTDVEIKRGQKTVLDLDTLKGEGPKYGDILFAVDVAGAILQIDGKAVDYSEAVPVQYGVHTLTVTADSYEPYTKKLFVNSEKATIVIGLSGDGGTSKNSESVGSEAGAGTAADGGTAGSLAGSLAGNHTAGGMGPAPGNPAGNPGGSGLTDGNVSEAELNSIVNNLLNEKSSDTQSDYLSTISKLLSELKGEE